MNIRVAVDADRDDIIALYKRSQAMTGIPNPEVYPPSSLGDELYSRDAIERYVAVADENIVGHGIIEHPNPLSLDGWRRGIDDSDARLVEFGAAFVEPSLRRSGIYTELLNHRLAVIRELGAIPVSATWSQNEHVQRKFVSAGGRKVARQRIAAGELCLFVF